MPRFVLRSGRRRRRRPRPRRKRDACRVASRETDGAVDVPAPVGEPGTVRCRGLRATTIAAVMAQVAACELYIAPTPAEPDAAPACDPARFAACAENCEYSCDRQATCVDGRVPLWQLEPTPCWEWTDSCAPVGYQTCAAGCDVEGAVWEVPGAVVAEARLCAESPTARVGDACPNGRWDCRPTRLEPQPDGSLRQIYLDCENRVCAEQPPPDRPTFLAACDKVDPAEVAPWIGSGATGVITNISTPCLLVDDGTCLHVGRTYGCDGDWDCPQGASCERLSWLDGEVAPTGGVCRPGLRGTPIAVELLPRRACVAGAGLGSR